MRKLYWAMALVLLTQASCAWAEFTVAEKTEAAELLLSAEKARQALDEVAEAVNLGSTADSRATLADAMQQVFDVVKVVNLAPIYLIHGSIGAAYFELPSQSCNDPNARTNLLRAVRDLTDVPGNDFHNALGYPQQFPLVEDAATRPLFRLKIREAFRFITGFWRRTDGTAWRMNRIPEAGID